MVKVHLLTFEFDRVQIALIVMVTFLKFFNKKSIRPLSLLLNSEGCHKFKTTSLYDLEDASSQMRR